MLVAAPTGSGKTVVAEFAIEQALAAGRKCFYTTPLKALSNQKFGDLVAAYGPQTVGLLTGDNTINGEVAGRRDDHRGAAEHAVRTQRHARRARLGRDGRGPLPPGPVPGRRLGGGADPSPALGQRGVPVGDDLERGGVRRVDRDAAGRDAGGDRGATARSARAPLPGRAPAASDARGAGRHPAAEPARRVAGSAGAPDAVLPAAGERPGPAPPDRPAARRASRGLRAAPRGGRRGPRAGGHAARDLLRVQPGGLRQERPMAPGIRRLADHPGGGRADPRARRDPGRVGRRAGPRRARLLRLPRRPDGGRRRASRGHAPGVQGDRRRALRGGAREGGVRHRDAVARDQHAGEDGRHRGSLEVPGRTARDPDPGRVHAAHGPGRPPRDRPSRPRGGALPAAGAVRARRRARRDAHLRPHVVVPALVQHGGQPGPELLARAGARAPELVVRAVPRRPRGRRAGAARGNGTSRRSRATGRTSAAIWATSTSTGVWSSGRAGSGRRTGGGGSRRARTRCARRSPP